MAVVHDSVMQTAWDGQTDTARPRVTWGHVEVAVFGFVIHFGCPFVVGSEGCVGTKEGNMVYEFLIFTFAALTPAPLSLR